MPLGEGGSWQRDGAFGWVLYHNVLAGRTLGHGAWPGFDLLLLQLVPSPPCCCPLLPGRCRGRRLSASPALGTNASRRGRDGCCDPLRRVPESLFQTQRCAAGLGAGCDDGDGLESPSHPLPKPFLGHRVAAQRRGCSAASAVPSLPELDHGALEALLRGLLWERGRGPQSPLRANAAARWVTSVGHRRVPGRWWLVGHRACSQAFRDGSLD